MKKIFLSLTVLVFFCTQILNSNVLLHTVNLDFEEGRPGDTPYGWYIPSYAVYSGFTGYLTDENPIEGRYCFKLLRDSIRPDDVAPYGSVMQSIEAEPYLGKRVLLRAAIRAEITSDSGSAHLWIREHLVNGQAGFFDMMEDMPIVMNQWDYYEIEGEISPYAKQINFGLVLIGTGKAWIDDVSIEIIEDEKEFSPPKTLSEQALRNLESFAKVYGNIRYFYAGKEAKDVDWEKFALEGIKIVENAQNAKQLAEQLDKLFKPIAPAFQIYKSKKNNDEIAKRPSNAFDDVALGWMYQGSCFGVESEYLFRKVVNILMPLRQNEGALVQVINADDIKGKTIEFDVAVKADVIEPFSQAQLWIRADSDKNRLISSETTAKNPIINNKWQRYSLKYDVPENASIIKAGLGLIGDGKAFFDDAKLIIYDNNKKIDEIQLKNGDFEKDFSRKLISQWRFMPRSVEAGYKATITTKKVYKGKQSLLISSDENSIVRFPRVGEVYEFDLDGIWKCSYPLNLYIDSLTTLPYPDGQAIDLSGDYSFSAKNRYSRLAITIILWNAYKHFNLYSNKYELDKALSEALSKASVDKTREDFLVTLQILTSYLNDGQARVWHPDLTTRYGFPFLWRRIDNNIVVTKVDSKYEKEIPLGSKIESIDGKPVESIIDSLKNRVSGATDRWKDLRALAMLRAGTKESKATITFVTPQGDKIEKEISRDIFLSDLFEYRPLPISLIDSGYFYVDLTRLDDEDFKRRFKPLVGAKGIVFDVRGSMLTSEHILGFFIDRPVRSCNWLLPIYTKPNKDLISNKIITNNIVPKPYLEGCKVIFLADDRTIGYGEVMLAIVERYKIGEIIGSNTAGTAGEHLAFRLPGNYYVSMTAMKVMKPDKTEIHGLGISPTIKLSPTIKGIINSKDEALERAFEMIVK